MRVNFGRLMVLLLLFAFVLPILPLAIALAQSTAVAVGAPVAAVDSGVVVKDPFPFGAVIQAVIALVSIIAAWFASHRGAKSGVVAGHEEVRTASKAKVDRF